MTSVNLPPPLTAERPEAFEDRQDDLKEFRDNVDGYLAINTFNIFSYSYSHSH